MNSIIFRAISVEGGTAGKTCRVPACRGRRCNQMYKLYIYIIKTNENSRDERCHSDEKTRWAVDALQGYALELAGKRSKTKALYIGDDDDTQSTQQ